jgi:uncharacterized SAM-dependent methyltransferase
LPPQEWRAPYDQMARESNLEYAFDDACRVLAKFYDDVVRNLGNE